MTQVKWQFRFNDSILNDKFGPVFLGARRNSRGEWLRGKAVPEYVRQYLCVTKESSGRFHHKAAKSCAELIQTAQENCPDSLHWQRSSIAKAQAVVAIDPPKRGRMRVSVPRNVPAIRNLKQLCEYFGAENVRLLNRRIYKDTACGASISVQTPDMKWHHIGEDWSTVKEIIAFTIQTIVGGSDATVDREEFVLPVRQADVAAWMDDMEAQADDLW